MWLLFIFIIEKIVVILSKTNLLFNKIKSLNKTYIIKKKLGSERLDHFKIYVGSIYLADNIFIKYLKKKKNKLNYPFKKY